MTQKLHGDSPLKLIMITFVIVFFVALFAWQIEKYLAASLDTKLQREVGKMNELIEIDNLDGFRIQKYAYLHSEEDEDVVFNTEKKAVNFEPETTLSMFLARNYFTPEGAPDEICFLYIYFPPGAAAKSFDFYDNQEPGYVIAAWSEYRSHAIVGASLGLNQWAKERLTARDFSCNPNDLRPYKLATDENGDLIDLPGINFQFSRYGYSKVKL